MKNKIVLITGATSGIGKVTAYELAKMGAHLILVARNKNKVLEIKDEILEKYGNEHIDIFIADLSSLQDVRHIAEKINSAYDRIDILINNAGLILGNKREESVDGNELTLATNHLGPFLLTALLFGLIQKSKTARIINLSSDVHKIAKADFKNIQLNKGYSSMKAYANSKLYNLLFTKELDTRVKKSGLNISVNAVHPGVVKTGFGKKSNGFTGFIFKALQPFFISPEKGAETSLFLATDIQGAQISGEYVSNKKVKKTNGAIVNLSNAKELWKLSEDLTGTKFL